jgi:hypothetical protein
VIGDRARTELQETGRVALSTIGAVSVEALAVLADELGFEEGELTIDDGYIVARARTPDGPQRFKAYLHGGDRSELRESMEGQGVRLPHEAWEAMGRPFYEVTLECEVDPNGTVRLIEARL